MANISIYRPKTRGELRDKLREGTACEVVSENVGITTIMLTGWLEFNNFTVKPSENLGWSIFEPTGVKLK